jgi:hypothetical protein
MTGPTLARGQSTEDTPPHAATGIRQPAVLVPVWWLLGSLCLVEALHELTGVGGPDAVLGIGMEAFLVSAAAVICLARALYEPRGRAPWLWVGTGLACWAVGTVLWDVVYSDDARPPYPSIADAFWLAWYAASGVERGWRSPFRPRTQGPVVATVRIRKARSCRCVYSRSRPGGISSAAASFFTVETWGSRLPASIRLTSVAWTPLRSDSCS